MPDSKITALTSISTSTDPANDPLVIVDVSDTSMAATGTTKKVTLNQLLGASGTATLASATITGDLTVDTNTLYVNSTSNNVGLGTLTPSGASGRALEIYGGAGQSRIALKNDTTGSASTDGSQIALVGSQLVIQNREASEITFETNNSERYRLASDGVATWSNVGGVAGTAMTLNANGLGIGVTPSGSGGCLQLKSGITFPATQVASSDANTLDDYEEGTFTPNITGTGVTGITYTTQSGVYTKIGRVVTFAINIAVSASTRAAAIFQIGNLPFSATGSVAYGGIISYSDSGFFATAASNKPNLLISSTDVVFYKSDGSAFNGTDIAANAFAIRIAGTYFTS